jgi:peptidoglycan/xylan/chitin deacetylase (PgdA/CDA1 family)
VRREAGLLSKGTKDVLRRLGIFDVLGHMAKSRYVILMYHGVSSRRKHQGITNYLNLHVHVDDFRSHMHYLTRTYRILSLSEMASAMSSGRKLQGTSVAVTFDDGYKNNFTNAIPLLKDLEIPATFFLTTDTIETGLPLWFDVIEHVVNKCSRSEITLPSMNESYDLSTLDSKKIADRTIKRFAKSLSRTERDAFVAELREACRVTDTDYDQDYLPMSWSDVKELAREGFSLGAHSTDHTWLMNMSDDELNAEIASAREIVEEKSKASVSSYAYPFGMPEDYDQRAKAACRQNGFACAVTAMGGANTVETDLQELRRYGIGAGCSLARFASIVSGFDDMMSSVRRR